MRIFAAAMGLEANTFSPLPSSYQAFTEKLYFPPGTHPPQATHQTAALWVAKQRAARDGFTLIEGSCYAAQPGGSVTRDAFARMSDEIIGQLKAAMPLDAVVLSLHGAMVAQGTDDCEGDLLERARAIVGPRCVIGIELDPHCHFTLKRCALADLIVLFKEYPHTDFVARGEDLLTLVLRAVRGQIKPVKSLYDCRTIGHFPTSMQPMRGLVDRVLAMEGKDRVLSISLGHGFPYGDVPEAGARVLVITDDAKAQGDRLAEALGEEMVAIRETAGPKRLTIDAAIDEALKEAKGPVVIADMADNAGGGAPSDNTSFLHRLIARKIQGAAVAPIWDPLAVRLAFDAGVGAKLPFRFGGKTAASSGPPVDADVEIIACVKNAHQTFAGSPVPLGDAAAIRFGGIEAVLISTRAQAMGIDLFANLGIDPASRKILVVKSTQHFYAAFSKIAGRVIYSEGDGPMPSDVRKLPWRKINRPIWPLDNETRPSLVV